MAARIWGGIAGWFFGLLPLVVVNVASYFGAFVYSEAVVAGAVGLVGGIVFGGVAAGMIGGRPRRGRAGGALAASVSGIVAAVLYAATVIGLLLGTGIRESAPTIIASHPIRFSIAVVFFASLLLGIALFVGAFAGRRTPTTAGIQQQRGTRQPAASASQPQRARAGYGAETPRSQPRYDEEVPAGRRYNDSRDDYGDYMGEYERNRQGAAYPAEPRYTGARSYDRQSRPARRPNTGPSSR